MQDTLERVEVVERHEVHEVGHRLRDAARGNAVRVVGRTEHVEAAPLRHHHRVVVPVIRALDLDDRIAAADGAHQVDGVHRRLGAGVVEAPDRHAEPPRQLAGDDDRVVGRLGEVRALVTRRCTASTIVGLAWPADHHAVSAVQIDVLRAVDIPHSTADVRD